ncbi:Transcription factor iws1 [Ascosphaera aggregata]|nr:Transcription factor iws1 [Ascosphaera aggregata]
MSASPQHRANSPAAQGANIAKSAAAAAATSATSASNGVGELREKNARDAELQQELETSQPNIYFESGNKDVVDTKADLQDVDELNEGVREEFINRTNNINNHDNGDDVGDNDYKVVMGEGGEMREGGGGGEEEEEREERGNGDSGDKEEEGGDHGGDASDDESVLSDVDEEQFQDFDPANVEIDDRPQLAIDEENLKLIGRHKRVRNEDGEWVERRKRREGRREKKKSRKKVGEEDENEISGGEAAGRRGRRRAEGGEGAPRRRHLEDDIDMAALDEPTRRRIELDRLMDQSMKKPTKRRTKKDGIDLNEIADAQIEEMRRRMTDAARLDSEAKKAGKPVFHKVKMLEDVVNLLNKTQYVNSLVDPEINLLEAVKFFLEPLDDGSLPAYEIRSKLMACLQKLPMNKEALIASGIGKVILLYTKSKYVEEHIKRQAEKLLADWTRLILQRSDDYSKRVYKTADFDPTKFNRRAPVMTPEASAADARTRELLPPRLANRARADAAPTSYTVVPKPVTVVESKFSRPMGATAEERWRKLKVRATKRRQ